MFLRQEEFWEIVGIMAELDYGLCLESMSGCHLQEHRMDVWMNEWSELRVYSVITGCLPS